MNGQLMQLPVYLADGRVEQVQVDSASTSGEMCRIIANRLGIKDNFGFSIYISVMDMVSIKFINLILQKKIFGIII